MTTVPEDKSWLQFKPLFTLQPVKATRDKQLKLWNELIMRHCREHKLSTIHPQSFTLFRNEAIDRQMSDEGILAVVECMVANGTVPGFFSLDTIQFIRLSSFDFTVLFSSLQDVRNGRMKVNECCESC